MSHTHKSVRHVYWKDLAEIVSAALNSILYHPHRNTMVYSSQTCHDCCLERGKRKRARECTIAKRSSAIPAWAPRTSVTHTDTWDVRSRTRTTTHLGVNWTSLCQSNTRNQPGYTLWLVVNSDQRNIMNFWSFPEESRCHVCRRPEKINL